MRRQRFVLLTVLVAVVGVALRTGPLWVSPLPYNPDGIAYAGLVRDTVSGGTMPLERMAVDSVGFTALLTVVTQVLGVRALSHSQGVLAVVGTLPALLAIAVGRRLAERLGLSSGRARVAGIVGGGLLAIEGLYLHRSMAVDEQTVGLLLVPVAVVGLAYARMDRRWLLPVGICLAVLPSVHNLDSLILALTLTVYVGIVAARGRATWSLVAIAAGFWLWFAGYTYGLAAVTPARVIQQARITTVPGLVIAWMILVVVGSGWLYGRSRRVQRVGLTAAFGSWFLLVGVNAVLSVFPGLPETHWLIVLGVVPLVVPVVAFAWSVPAVEGLPAGRGLVALVGGVGCLIGVGLTAALTGDYLNMLYRAQTFAHFPVLVGAGIGIVGVGLGNPRVRVVVAVLAVVASLPIVAVGFPVIPYEGVTSPQEFAASGFASQYADERWASDDHVVRVSAYYGARRTGAVTPVYEWARGGSAPTMLTIVQPSWTTQGVQLYPAPPLVVRMERYQRSVVSQAVVYDAGATRGIVRPR